MTKKELLAIVDRINEKVSEIDEALVDLRVDLKKVISLTEEIPNDPDEITEDEENKDE